jgi:glycosyltransferase involved in cell wall biosynthesis
MKKILFFIRSLNVGGAERQLVVTAKGLAERGYDVTVLTFYSGGAYAEELRDSKVRLLSLHKKGRWDLIPFFFSLISVLRSETPDAVYSFLGVANIFSVLARPFVPNTRVIWGVRASNMDLRRYDWATRWSYWVECRLARFADLIVTNSRAGLGYSVVQGFPRAKMVAIPNGIDTERFQPDKMVGKRLRETWGIGEDERLIGLIGRIDPMKDHSTFLKAAALIRQQVENVRFVCVGKGQEEYEKSMRRLATEMGLDDVLVWAGEHANMMEVYNALDIASSSSSYGEGFPNVVGEAMSCSVPCVVTDVGDSALLVGRTGWVVPPNDTEALCSVWSEMLLLEEMEFRAKAVAARNRVISQFSINDLLNSTEQSLFREIDCAELSEGAVKGLEFFPMKKILFFIRSLNVGGAERQLVITAKGLAERGYDVTVLTFYSGGDYAEELRDSKVRLLSLHKKGRWDLIPFFFSLISVLRSETPDAVYSFLVVANIFSVLARPFVPNTRVIWGVRASNMDLSHYDWVARLTYWVECRLARFADLIVANSRAGLKYAMGQGFPRVNMVAIPNGIDTERFQPDKMAGKRLRETWGIGEDERLIGLIGRIDPMKGHSTFLKAAALIRHQVENIRFVCVGNGQEEYEKSMHSLATEMGLDDVLVWAGEHSNMMGVYSALDIASSSSYGEGFPNVVGEAMSCSVPCVVTDVGDSALLVGRTGWVVPPNDTEALCSVWSEMLLLEEMEFRAKAVAARNRVISQFSINDLLNSTEQLLCREVGCAELSEGAVKGPDFVA